jgi:hypothetical protein
MFLRVVRRRHIRLTSHCHLCADRVECVRSTSSHNPIGFSGLLEVELYTSYSFSETATWIADSKIESWVLYTSLHFIDDKLHVTERGVAIFLSARHVCQSIQFLPKVHCPVLVWHGGIECGAINLVQGAETTSGSSSALFLSLVIEKIGDIFVTWLVSTTSNLINVMRRNFQSLREDRLPSTDFAWHHKGREFSLLHYRRSIERQLE